MAIRLCSTGRASITLRGGEVPAQAGVAFEVETEAQAERLVRKGYAVRVEVQEGGEVASPRLAPDGDKGPELVETADEPKRRGGRKKGEG